MSVNLKNLKNNTSREIAGIHLSKGSGQYTLSDESRGSYADSMMWYDKDTKAWYFTAPTANGEKSVKLPEATMETAFDLALAAWEELNPVSTEPTTVEEAAEATPAPSTELVLVTKTSTELAVIEAEVVKETTDENTTLDYQVNTKGGHGPHRAAAILRIFEALGLHSNTSYGKGARYREDSIMVHGLGAPELVESIEEVLDDLVADMEAMAEATCRKVSKRAKAAGQHHSHLGALARRGYMRGFGAGVADALSGAGDQGGWSTSDSEVTTQAFDTAEWINGHAYGVVYGESMIRMAQIAAGEAEEGEDEK